MIQGKFGSPTWRLLGKKGTHACKWRRSYEVRAQVCLDPEEGCAVGGGIVGRYISVKIMRLFCLIGCFAS